jgi:hypothetical protein
MEETIYRVKVDGEPVQDCESEEHADMVAEDYGQGGGNITVEIITVSEEA